MYDFRSARIGSPISSGSVGTDPPDTPTPTMFETDVGQEPQGGYGRSWGLEEIDVQALKEPKHRKSGEPGKTSQHLSWICWFGTWKKIKHVPQKEIYSNHSENKKHLKQNEAMASTCLGY